MARKNASQNGHERLEEAMALLIRNRATLVQTQTAMVQNQTAFLARLAEMERASAERFARIEADIGAILRVLAEHGRLLERLPEAVREKIGFKTKESESMM